MCLALPAKVVEEKGGKAVVELFGQRKDVFNLLNARKGQFVLVQQGFIAEILEEKEALDALEAVEK